MTVRRRMASDAVLHNTNSSHVADNDSSICSRLSERRTRWWVVLFVLAMVVVVWDVVESRSLMTTTWQFVPMTDVILGSIEHSAAIAGTTTVRYNTTTHTSTTTLMQAPLITTSSDITSSSLKSQTGVSTMNRNRSNTLIIGFADQGYQAIAWTWYQELSKLGYTEHMVVAQDLVTVAYFKHRGMRHDYIHTTDLQKEALPMNNITNFRKERCTEYDRKYGTAARRHQIYKRSLFGSRWTYVFRTLQAGFNVLLTDVDNVFVRYLDMSELEQEPFDSMHAYAGFLSAFPRNIFATTGFTICGGMSWLRSAPGVMAIVQTLVDRCGCQSTLYCHCKCDDQVVLNTIMLTEDTYKIAWDHNVTVVPTLEEEVRWEEMTGTCTNTSHRVKIWDRNIAFRRNVNQKENDIVVERPVICPDPNRSWIAMPSGVNRFKVYDEWRAYCPLL
jgi:hypothetical protein